MRALVIRHYRTEFNETGRLMGWEDSPRGREWKADFDFVDACLREHGIRFDAIYSSDLERSRQTAKLHADNHDISAVQDTRQLNEINYGRLQKLRKSWIRRFFPQHKSSADLVYPGGESFRQMQLRSVDFFTSLAASNPEQTILIVTHAGVIRGFVSHFLGLDFNDHLKHPVSFRYIGDYEFDGPVLKRYDELGDPSGFVESGAIKLPMIIGESLD
ncbi:MAG: histidine phosphatase family protein [Gammaproteobacteria bacterium]|nr:histidine phosphatase family protein [Gammaproteobacteria bacterium]